MKADFRRSSFFLRCLTAAAFCVLSAARPAQAQCLYAAYGAEPSTVFTPQCSGTSELNAFGRSSSYSLVIVTPGISYTFSSSVATDVVTIGNKGGTVALASGTGSVIYTSATYDTLRFYTHANTQCSDTPSYRTRTLSCTFPAPVNNACNAAAILTPGTGVTPPMMVGTTAGASTATEAAPLCNASGVNDDVWYKFSATASTHTVVLSDVSVALGVQVYSGSCGVFTAIQGACGTVTNWGTVTTTGLAIGNTYFIRVFSTSSTAGVVSNFKIGVGTRASNDVCDSAIMLPVSASTSCTGTAVFSTAGGSAATLSYADCNQMSYNDAVWFRFIATAPVHRLNVSSAGAASTVIQAYTGPCGSLLSPGYVSCNLTDREMVVTGLTPGDTVTVRAASLSATVGVNSTFAICISTPPARPANDDWMGAFPLTPSANEVCGTTVSGSTEGATRSANLLVADPTCNSSAPDDDVWFKFTATRAYHTLLFQNTSAPIVAQLYYESSNGVNYFGQVTQGASCATISAAPGEKKPLAAPNLFVGRTYYLRISSSAATVNFLPPVTFDVCVISAPANDVATGAIPLTPQPGGNVVPVAGTTYSASGNSSSSVCSNVAGVWYKFTATSTTHAVSVTGASPALAVRAYENPYSNYFSPLGCAQSSGGNALVPLTGLTAGTTYYVQVGLNTPSVTNYALFNIAVLEPPANTNCTGALPLPVSPTASCPTPILGSTLAANTSIATAPDCNNAGLDDDIWYSFVATDTVHRLRLRALVETLAVQVYAGSCAALVPHTGGCLTVTPSGPANPAAMLSNLTIGQTYFVRIWTPVATVGLAGLYDLCVQAQPPQPANDSCAGAIVLATTPAGVQCTSGVAGVTDGARDASGNYPRCLSSDQGVDDVWYKFVATNSDVVVRLRDIRATYGSVSTVRGAVYSGSCGALTQLRCFQNAVGITTASTLVGGLAVGDTFYVRVFSGQDTYAGFSICVQDTIPAAPLNCSYVASPGSGDTGVSLTPTFSLGQSTNATVYDFYLGASPATAVLVASIQAGATYTPQTPLQQSTTYYAYVIARNSAGTPPTNCAALVRSFKTLRRPSNDTADRAVLLTVGASCNPFASTQPYSLRYASQSFDEPFPGCRADVGRATVWYKFNAPASGAVRIRVGFGSQATRVSLFSAVDSSNYATFTDIACGASSGSASTTALYAADLTPAARYYIAVDAYNPASTITATSSFCVEVHELDSTMLSTTSSCSTTDSSRADFKRTYRGWVSAVNATGLQANVRLTGTPDSTFVGKQYRTLGLSRSGTMAAGLVRSYLERNLTLRSDSGAAGYQLQLFMTRQEYNSLQTADAAFDSLTQMVVTRKTSTACLGSVGTSAASDSLLLPMDEGAVPGVRYVTVRTKLLGAFFMHRGTPALTGCFPPVLSAPTGLSTTGATLNWGVPPGGTPAGYDYEVRTAGAPGSGTAGLVASGTTPAPVVSAAVTGLSANTAYAAYVRTSCGGSNASAWAGPQIFSTTCASITAQPMSDTICAGVPVTFGVSATGASAYQWRRDSVNIVGAASPTYTLTFPTPADSNKAFDVVVTPALAGCPTLTSAPAVLTVNSHTWTGAASMAWTVPANWSGCGVPTATSFVEIPAPGPAIQFMPEISSAVSVWMINSAGSISVAPGGSLQILGN